MYRQAVFPTPEPPTTTRITFITGGSSPYWTSTVRGAEQAAKDYDAKLDVLIPRKEEDLTSQMKLLVAAAAENCDGIAISPLDAESQTHSINQLSEKKSVVTFDSDAPLSLRKFHIGTSNYLAGQLCHELITEAMGGGGEVVLLMANLTKSNMLDRKLGFEEHNEDADGESKVVVVDELLDDGDSDTVIANVEKVLEAHPNLAGIVAMNSYHGPLLVQLGESNDALGKVKLVTFDTEVATLAGIEDDVIYGTIAQDPYMFGYEAVRTLTRINAGSPDAVPIVGGGILSVPCEALRKDSVADFRKRIEKREGVKKPWGKRKDKTARDTAAKETTAEADSDADAEPES